MVLTLEIATNWLDNTAWKLIYLIQSKKVSPSVPKTDETNIFKDYSVELTKKDDKWAFSDKDSYVEKWDYYLLSYTYTG